MKKLKQLRQWICWNLKTKDGRATKVPCAAGGGATGTDSPHASTWVTWQEAVSAAQTRHYTGVGFVIPQGYFFLDVDHRDTSDPLVQTLLNRFNTYAERSFSSNGLHIYGRCDLARLPIQDGKLARRYYTKNPNNGLELYVGGLTNRFAVFTGDAIQDVPLADCTDAILTTLEQDMRRETTAPAAIVQLDNSAVTEEDIFEIVTGLRAAKNGDKFRRLYDEGDISGYGSHSEADAGLCAVIAFRTGPNPEMIDAIFRRSALYREEKWERDDYRESTIRCGIEACHGTFHGNAIGKPPFIITHPRTGADTVCATRLAQHIRQTLRYFFVQDHAMSGARCYVYRDGAYRLMSRMMMMGVIKQYIVDYNEHLVEIGTLGKVYDLLLTDNIFVSEDDLNTDEDLINFQNGLLRLSDMTLLPHTPDIYSTIQLPCNWPAKPLPAPVYDAYMDTLTGGDQAVRQLLEEFCGVCLSNIRGWRLKKALFMYGPGDTGKSVLKTLVEQLLGKGNFIGIDLGEIEARFGTGSIYGKRLAGSSDMSFMTVAELKTFKKCTGGDSIFAEFKGQQSFEYTYTGLLWFCMNRLPKFGGDDGKWVYERIVQVPCTQTISSDKQDKRLLEKLLAEKDGIVYRMVLALKNVIAHDYRLTEPESIKAERQHYQEENSTVITFFQDCMQPLAYGDRNMYVTAMTVYTAYQGWCRDNNRGYAKSAREFKAELAAYLETEPQALTLRHRQGMVYRHYTLTRETLRQYAGGGAYHSGQDFYTPVQVKVDDLPNFCAS